MKTIAIECTGYSIPADLYPGNDNKVLLVMHGWDSTRKSQEVLTNFLVNETGTTALVIEYSGHGDSPLDRWEIKPAQHFLEVITAFDWLRQQYPNAEISVLGTSYGAYMAVQLTKYREFKNLILRVPAIYRPQDFYSPNREVNGQYEKHYREDEAFLDSHPLLARASNFKGRTLVVWHDQDEYIPKELVDKYIEVFHADSYCAKGWKHSFKVDAPEAEQVAYRNAIRDWLQRGAGAPSI